MRAKLDHPLFQKLKSLNLSPDDFVISCSGVHYAYGIIDEIHDLDIVARGQAWESVKSLGETKKSMFGDETVSLFEGQLEFFSGFLASGKTVDELIAGSVIVDGIRFMDIKMMRQAHLNMGRPKDYERVKLIDVYLNEK